MRKTAILLILAGLVFAFFSLPFEGIDLLIDAVGFLLVWNGVRALQKQTGQFAFGPVCSGALVVVCAAALFVPAGLAANLLLLTRGVLEAALILFLMLGFGRLAKEAAQTLDAALAKVAPGLFVAGWAVYLAAALLPGSLPPPLAGGVLLVARVALCLLLVRYAVVFGGNPGSKID